MENDSERSIERRPKKERSHFHQVKTEILRFAAIRLFSKALDWIIALI